MQVKLLSWNVNGVRAAAKKGLLSWISAEKPFIVGLQETKAAKEQLPPELAEPEGYFAFWNAAQRPGYSGTAALAREKPLNSRFGLGVPELDGEGRAITLEYPQFNFVNVYFPNGG
jgi:exodeoxyribonuclease-3